MANSLSVSVKFDSPQLRIQQKETVAIKLYWPRDMLNFDFPENKGLGLVSSPHFFVYDFSKKNVSNVILY